MAPLILLFSGLFLIGWVISGYPRGIDVEVNKYFFIGIRKKILFVIDGDLVPGILSRFPLPFPFRHIEIQLKWSEWIDGQSKTDEKVTGSNDKKFKEVTQFDEAPDGFMGQRDEMVPWLLKYEPTGYNIPVKNKDGFDENLIFTFYLHVFDPMKVVKRPNFKMLGEKILQTKIGPWAFDKAVNEIQATDVDTIKDPKCGIVFKGGIDMETYLNENIFRPLGFEIDSVELRVIDGKKTAEYFDLLNDNKASAQKAINAATFGKQREAERAIELADAEQESKIETLGLKSINEGIKEIIVEVYKGQADVEAQHPHLLIDARHQSDQTGPAIIAESFNALKEIAGKNASKKQKMENESKAA